MANTQFPKRFGKYILLDRLASGGMAEVYRAKLTGAEQFQRLIAIKCMLPNLVKDEQFTTMFIDEAKIAAQLNHANIVQIYELGRIEERLYIAMELINGRDLRHIIKTAAKKNMPIPLGFACYAIAKAAEGLDAAHRKTTPDGLPFNLVHRDVSPQNILVSYDGEVKVVDFGIAKAEERSTETKAGVLKGKFAYMAPEQVMGKELDRRTDIFALGAVLYETVTTGKKLFGGESDLSILEKVRNAEVPDVREVIPNAPMELQLVLKTALAKNREDRYAWGSEMSEALEPLLIQDRGIFGSKKASEFMQQIYVDEIQTLAEQVKKWLSLDADDGAEIAAEPEVQKTQIFESAFDASAAPNKTAKLNIAGELAPGWENQTATASAAPEAGSTQIVDQAAPAPQVRRPTMTSPGTNPQARAPSAPAPVQKTDYSDVFGKEPAHAPPQQKGLSNLPLSVIMDAGPAPASLLGAKSAGQKKRPPKALFIGAAASLVLAVGITLTVLFTGGEETPEGAPAVAQVPGAVNPAVPGQVPAPAVGVAVSPQPTPTGLTQVTTVPTTPTGLPPGTVTPTPVTATTTPMTATTTTVTPTPVTATATPVTATTTPVVTTTPSESEPPGKEDKPKKGLAGGGAKWGYVSVMAKGVVSAKVFIDGKEAGYSPLVFFKVKTGKRKIKVVEDNKGTPGSKQKTLDIDVTPKNDRKSPLKLVVPL